MLRTKPCLSYCGLTLVLDQPSRFDKVSLLTSGGGRLFNSFIRPDFNIGQCDIRIKEDTSPLLPNTKCIMLLGEDAAKSWLHNDKNTIGEIRGSVFKVQDIPTIPTFFPQDAADIKDYEGEFNSSNPQSQILEKKVEKEALAEKRRHGRTERKNYAFWISKDVEKVKYVLKNGSIPARPFEPHYEIYPSAQTVIDILSNTKAQNFFIDLETDCNLNILCFSFNFGCSDTIFCVPTLSPDYSWAYTDLPEIYRALAIAINDNIAIAHNGAAFDFFVLAHKYHIPLGPRSKDTMLMQHRCYPEVEMSLGHCTSIWTWEPFHKDEGGGGYGNKEQQHNLLAYCGKDTYTMRLIHDAILIYAKRIPGLLDSIDQVNSSIRPYLIMTLQGIRYEQEVLEKVMKENDEYMMQYLRCIRLLIGEDTARRLQLRFKSALPSSNPQCCLYFHEMLGYPVVGRGKTKKDGTRGPSLAKKNMYKLRLKFNNPVIDFIIAYRETAKESGSLKFTPWKTDENM